MSYLCYKSNIKFIDNIFIYQHKEISAQLKMSLESTVPIEYPDQDSYPNYNPTAYQQSQDAPQA